MPEIFFRDQTSISEAGFCVEMGSDFVAERRWLELASRPADSNIADVVPLLNERAHKLLINLPDISADETLSLIDPLLRGEQTHACRALLS